MKSNSGSISQPQAGSFTTPTSVGPTRRVNLPRESQNELVDLLCNFLHQAKVATPLWHHAVFRAKVCKRLQPLFLPCSEAESKIFVVITIEKFLYDCLFVMSGVCHSV